MILRRLLLLALVAYCAFLVYGCATPDVACNMRIDYASETPMAASGNVRLAWRFDAEQKTGNYGITDCYTTDGERLCLVRLKGPPPSFSDVCGMAKLAHELGHVLEAKHSE